MDYSQLENSTRSSLLTEWKNNISFLLPVCLHAAADSLSPDDWTLSEGEYLSSESVFWSSLSTDKPFSIVFSVKFVLSLDCHYILVFLTNMGFLFTYISKSQYKSSKNKIYLRLKQQMSAISRCKVVTNFSSGLFNSATTLVAINHCP